ncbi:MAG: hypothetical protein AAFO29_08255, partial [Actinomycetota bacterium]
WGSPGPSGARVTAVSLVSFSGAPGATTVALATAAALSNALPGNSSSNSSSNRDSPGTTVGEPVLVEMATSGGVVAGWYDLPAEPGLSTLALAIGNDTPELLAHAQELPGGLPAVVAPPSGSRVTKLLGARATALAAYLRDTEVTVVADCGRISVDTPLRPILESSTLVGVVIRPSREDFRLAATALAELNTVAANPLPAGWILVGDSPWSVDEILSQYGLPVLAVIAEDANGAAAVAGRRRLRRHAPLSRSVQSFADDIVKHLRVAPAHDPLAYLRADGPTRAASNEPSPAPSDPGPSTGAGSGDNNNDTDTDTDTMASGEAAPSDTEPTSNGHIEPGQDDVTGEEPAAGETNEATDDSGDRPADDGGSRTEEQVS